jgi:hypothetical protein
VPPPVYSLRIFAHGGLTNAGGTVGPVVPNGLLYVVRDITVQRGSSGASDNLIVFNQVTGVLLNIVVGDLDAGGGFQWQGRQVYNTGEQVGFHAFVGTWAVACSGYQLTLP